MTAQKTMCLLHVHAVGTAGANARERRKHVYAKRCSQCGVDLEEATHVASHVLTYPLFWLGNCCVAKMCLKTCCRSCNSKHQRSHAGRFCRRTAYFCSCASAGDVVEEEECVVWPSCWIKKSA